MENSSLRRFDCEIPEALLDRVSMGFELPALLYLTDRNGFSGEAV